MSWTALEAGTGDLGDGVQGFRERLHASVKMDGVKDLRMIREDLRDPLDRRMAVRPPLRAEAAKRPRVDQHHDHQLSAAGAGGHGGQQAPPDTALNKKLLLVSEKVFDSSRRGPNRAKEVA